MTPAELAVRLATYRLFVDLGRAPALAEVATATGEGIEGTLGAWRRLHDAHALVLDDPQSATPAIRMANPFSAVETPFRVHAAGRDWYANCAWDAFGIGAALHVDSEFETACPDCGDPIHVAVRGGRPADAASVFHVLVPAARWWADIGFT